MEKVILRRSALRFRSDRPLQFLGEFLGALGMAALGVVVAAHRLPSFVVVAWPALILVLAVFPFPVLTADRDGVSSTGGRDRTPVGWKLITQVVVVRRARTVSVGIRTRPPRGAPPFAFASEVVLSGHHAAEKVGLLRGVAPAPVVVAGGDDRRGYSVRAPLRSYLPMLVLLAVWAGGAGAAITVALVQHRPHAVTPLTMLLAGAVLTLADGVLHRVALRADCAGLRFEREFLPWREIAAVGVTPHQDGTELLIRPAPGSFAGKVEPEVRRVLRGVRVDRSRLARALPPGVEGV